MWKDFNGSATADCLHCEACSTVRAFAARQRPALRYSALTKPSRFLQRVGVDPIVILLGGARTLFHLVISMSLAASLGGALSAVKLAGGGLRLYLLGLPLGLLIGLVCSYASLLAVRAAGSRRPRLLFAGAVIWLIVSAFLGDQITRSALRAASCQCAKLCGRIG
jgi:hypothetical protein